MKHTYTHTHTEGHGMRRDVTGYERADGTWDDMG